LRECLNPSFAEHDPERLLVHPDQSLDRVQPDKVAGATADAKESLVLSTRCCPSPPGPVRRLCSDWRRWGWM